MIIPRRRVMPCPSDRSAFHRAQAVRVPREAPRRVHGDAPLADQSRQAVVDADHSGGRYHSFDDVDEKTEAQLKSTTAQNYHIYTPPGEGKAWAWVWGEQQWLIKQPWAEQVTR